jgi:purine-binding chemotaxis protein CheW
MNGNSYGGFRLSGLELALPMNALREVVPCDELIRLPSTAACVVGGINLRGVLVPVVDLRLVLGQAGECGTGACVVLMVHGGRILGLLCDSVTGIFSSRDGHVSHITVADPTAALFAGSIQRADDGTLVNLLSPQALAGLHQVPMVDDPEPGRQLSLTDTDAAVVIDEQSVPMMLFRCGRVPLAIGAMTVYATLSHPKVQQSALTRGHCQGVLDYAGQQIPVVDMLGLCGLDSGHTRSNDTQHAFVVQMATGLLAFLVDKVLDVVLTQHCDVMMVPAFALPHPVLFAGALPTTALPADILAEFPAAVSQFLLVDGAALRADESLLELARMGVDRITGEAATVSTRSLHRPDQRSMITYLLGVEMASPIEQVAEILPYSADVSIFERRGALLGLVAHRGRSIPVLCLSRLIGQPSPTPSPAVSVLVVETDGALIGFAVPALRSIESADWEPALPRVNTHSSDELSLAVHSRQLAQINAGGQSRMLPVMDLKRIACVLQRSALAG